MIRDRKCVVVYDISDDKRRRKLYKVLKSFGIRTQFSFFECLLSRRQEVELRFRILDLIVPGEDRVGFIHLCDGCFSRIERHGYAEPDIFGGNDLVF